MDDPPPNPRTDRTEDCADGFDHDGVQHSKKNELKPHLSKYWKIPPDANARFVEDGFEAAIERKPREKPPRDIIFDGAFEARLITLACSNAPEGRRRWTVRLLADKAVELKFAESVSHMTVQRVLKKTNLSLTSASTGKSLPKGVRPL